MANRIRVLTVQISAVPEMSAHSSYRQGEAVSGCSTYLISNPILSATASWAASRSQSGRRASTCPHEDPSASSPRRRLLCSGSPSEMRRGPPSSIACTARYPGGIQNSTPQRKRRPQGKGARRRCRRPGACRVRHRRIHRSGSSSGRWKRVR